MTDGDAAAIEYRNVTKRFGDITAVDDVSFEVRQGELLALLGPSGSGKTTTLRMLAGFETPTEGRITLAGRDVTTVPTHKRDTGMVFQDYALFPHMTVGENIAFGLKRKGYSSDEIDDRIEEVLSMVDLSGFRDRSPPELSGGQQQRVSLGRAMVMEPDAFLLDEPEAGAVYDALLLADGLLISAGTAAEALIVSDRRGLGEQMRALFEDLGVEIAPVNDQLPERYEGLAELVLRLQQLTGPVMAKAVEDTLFYRHTALLADCEVGCDPVHLPARSMDVHPILTERARRRRYCRGACLLRMRCRVRRCILSRRAVSETLRSHCSNTRWMCSQRTRSADIGLSGGGGSGRSSWDSSAASTWSASAGLAI